MTKIGALTQILNTRRQRLRALLDELGPAEVERKTGLAASYLRSMTKDRQRDNKARGISDDNAALIEIKCGRPDGWLSGHEHAIAEDTLGYNTFDRALLRRAIIQVETKLGAISASEADLRADIILGAYDMLIAGQNEDTVAGFLAGTQFAPRSGVTKAR